MEFCAHQGSLELPHLVATDLPSPLALLLQPIIKWSRREGQRKKVRITLPPPKKKLGGGVLDTYAAGQNLGGWISTSTVFWVVDQLGLKMGDSCSSIASFLNVF